jgi:hypothetical protein
MKKLPVRFWIGLSLLMDGALLFFFRMPLTYVLIGHTRTRLGLMFGVDRLHAFLWSLIGIAFLCTISGIALMYFSLSSRESAGSFSP